MEKSWVLLNVFILCHNFHFVVPIPGKKFLQAQVSTKYFNYNCFQDYMYMHIKQFCLLEGNLANHRILIRNLSSKSAHVKMKCYKLRKWLDMFISFRFKWSNLMDEDEKTVTNNVDEDMASMMFAAGIWHLEHAHLVSVVSFKILHCFEN